ncbi:hypothetical protein GOODEAATRI_007200, partial [Goodea atripinnis]
MLAVILLFVCFFLGDFKSKPQSSCSFQPWLKVSALDPAKVRVPKLPSIYLDQVLADSLKPSSSSSELCSPSTYSQSTSSFLKPHQTQQQSHRSPWLHIILPRLNSSSFP